MRKPSIKTLRKKLKKVCHEYIRKRDTLFGKGYGHCITCGKRLYWNDAQANAGHFVSVGSATQGTEYDERNIHLQCVYCNNWGEGKKPEYALFMIKKYGEGIIEKLIEQSKWSLVKFAETMANKEWGVKGETWNTQDAYEYLIDLYTKKLGDLK